MSCKIGPGRPLFTAKSGTNILIARKTSAFISVDSKVYDTEVYRLAYTHIPYMLLKKLQYSSMPCSGLNNVHLYKLQCIVPNSRQNMVCLHVKIPLSCFETKFAVITIYRQVTLDVLFK